MKDLFHGYVTVKISGASKERFWNMCRMKHIKMWDLKENDKDSSVIMCMSGRDLLDSKNAIRKSGVKVAVLEKSGLPFFYRRLLKRAVFVAGILFCAFFLIAMMQKIWCIQLEGNRKITDDELIGFLNKQDIRIGCNIKDISYEELEAGIRENFNDIIWASVIRKGTTLIIRIKENEFYNEAAVYEDYTDLRSEYDGTILSMVVRKGVPLVKIGDTVAKGDIMVQGAVPILDENSEICKYQYCHAQADILIQTQEIYEETISRVHEVRIYGENSKGFEIGFGTRFFQIGKKRSSDNVISSKSIHQMVLFDYLYLPLYLNITTYTPYETVDETYTQEEAQQILTDNLEKYLHILSEKGVQIVRKDVKIIKNGMIVQIIANLTLNRNAGISTETTVELTEHGEDDN